MTAFAHGPHLASVEHEKGVGQQRAVQLPHSFIHPPQHGFQLGSPLTLGPALRLAATVLLSARRTRRPMPSLPVAKATQISETARAGS